MFRASQPANRSVTVGNADPVNFTITSDLALSETSGPPGATVSITGSGFAANSFFNLTFNGQTLRTVTVDGGGRVSTSFQVPEAPGGPNSVGLGGKALSFTVTPSLTVGNEDATPGATVTVSGSGYYRNEGGITVTVGGSAAASGIRADANGSWTSPIVVPSLAAGSHRGQRLRGFDHPEQRPFRFPRPGVTGEPGQVQRAAWDQAEGQRLRFQARGERQNSRRQQSFGQIGEG